jgi:hypothetical protein
VWICLVSRLPQRSFVYLVSVYVLDPNLPPVAPPLIRFENGVLGIVGNYFGGLFSALSFDFPSHMRSPLIRPLVYVCLLRFLITPKCNSSQAGGGIETWRLPRKNQLTPVRFKERLSDLAPRFFIFGYRGWTSAEVLRKNFIRVSEQQSRAHIHGVCCLGKTDSYFIGHQAFAKGETRFSPVASNGFRNFLISLPTSLESMLPFERGFDRANVKHYEPNASGPEPL